MRKKLVGILLILLAALVIVQDYFIKWEISIWMLAWVVLLAILSLSSLLKRHFGLGFAYGIVALFSLNGQFHFLPVSNSVLIFSSILLVKQRIVLAWVLLAQTLIMVEMILMSLFHQ